MKNSKAFSAILQMGLLILVLVGNFDGILGTNAQNTCEGIVQVDVSPRGTFLRAVDLWPFFGQGDYAYDDDLETMVGVSTNYRVESPVVVDLVANGFLEGDQVMISYEATVYMCGTDNPSNPVNTNCGVAIDDDLYSSLKTGGGLIGLFSSTSELRPIDELHRVPGAIYFGDHSIETPTTLWTMEYQLMSAHLKTKNFNWYTGSMVTDIPEDFLIKPYTGMYITIPRNAKFLFLSIIDTLYQDNMGVVKVTIEKDTDGDGIPDPWERNGIDIDCDGQIELDLPMMGADWLHKDIFVEIDYMQTHKPRQESIDDVIAAFANAPISNPDLINGINLHVIMDESLPFQELLNSWEEFQIIKSNHFGSVSERSNPKTIQAKKLVFRYGISVHKLWLNPPEHKTPGISEGIPCDDFILASGAFADGYGSRQEQAALFMHELGHTLGLHHGGGDGVNYKPNYLSIMNYRFQYDYLLPGRPLDYSRESLRTIDENNIDERIGIGKATKTVWHAYWRTPQVYLVSPGVIPIDWNDDGNLTSGFKLELSNDPREPMDVFTELHGFDDWSNLVYRFRGTKFFAASAIPEFPDELTTDVIEHLKENAKNIIEISTPTSYVPPTFGVKEGDWMEYQISYADNPSDYLPSMIRIEVEAIQETNITLTWEIERLNGEKTSLTETYDFTSGVEDFMVVSANLKVADSFYHEQIGIIEIGGVEDYTYAGEERSVVWAMLSFDGYEGSVHWDQRTGIVTQGDWTYPSSLNATWVLKKTNLWGLNQGLDPLLMIGIAVIIVLPFLVLFFMRKRKNKRNEN
jgi:hypothetical protein